MDASKGFRILPFNHVHVLSETVNEVRGYVTYQMYQ